MKRMIAILLSVVVMTGLFAACSATTSFDRGYGYDYGNVSTTPNGRVNGTNGDYGSGNNGYGSGNNGYGNNSYGSNNPGSSYSGNNGTNNNRDGNGSNSFGSNGYANNGSTNFGTRSDSNSNYHGRENNIMSDTETGTGMIGGQ